MKWVRYKWIQTLIARDHMRKITSTVYLLHLPLLMAITIVESFRINEKIIFWCTSKWRSSCPSWTHVWVSVTYHIIKREEEPHIENFWMPQINYTISTIGEEYALEDQIMVTHLSVFHSHIYQPKRWLLQAIYRIIIICVQSTNLLYPNSNLTSSPTQRPRPTERPRDGIRMLV